MERFEIFMDSRGAIRWRLRDPGGETVATSEAYLSEQGCQNAIRAVKKFAPTADVVDLILPPVH
jgi:uncharacterized protein YegP (UPF0339 family)